MTVNTGATVSLQGSATDADSTSLTYAWEQVSGTTVTLGQADTPTAEFTAPNAAAELSFSLTVTDDHGQLRIQIRWQLILSHRHPYLSLPHQKVAGAVAL